MGEILENDALEWFSGFFSVSSAAGENFWFPRGFLRFINTIWDQNCQKLAFQRNGAWASRGGNQGGAAFGHSDQGGYNTARDRAHLVN